MTRKHTEFTPEAQAAMPARRENPHAFSGISFDPEERRIALSKSNGQTFSFPVSLMEEFADASDAELSALRLSPAGDTIISDELDLHVSVEGISLTDAHPAPVRFGTSSENGVRIKDISKKSERLDEKFVAAAFGARRADSVDYGFLVGDTVRHVKDDELTGIVTELDADHDQGGVTTCRVAWEAKTVEEAMTTPRDDQDIQWTNKLVRVPKP